MLKFDLKPDEYVVIKSEEVHHGGPISSFTDGLVLTNQNLILVSRGVFGNTKSVERFPLGDVKYIDGRVQAVATDRALEVYFMDRHESFEFRSKREAKDWAKRVGDVIQGNPDLRPAKDRALPGVEVAAAAVKDTIDALRRPFTMKQPRQVAKTCKGCGAAIKGAARSVVLCDHCGLERQLPRK
jgi:hypothetical protein